MRRLNICLLIILSGLLFTGCNRKAVNLVRPGEAYETDYALKPSVLNIPIEIELAEVERQLEQQLPDTLYEDKDMRDDQLALRAVKREAIKVDMEGMTIKYRVPLDLFIKYDAGITTVKADGALALDFATLVEVDDRWQLKTTTELSSHEWLEKPRLRVGGMGIGIGFVADAVVKRSREVITRSIDQQITQGFDLRARVDSLWQQLFQDIKLSDDYAAWLRVNPTGVEMSRPETSNGRLRATIAVEGNPRVYLGDKPAINSTTPLPPLNMTDAAAADDFNLYLEATMSYEEAERIAKEQLLNERFENGKYHATITDLELYGQGELLVVNTSLSGSYNGSIYFTGRPVFNPRSNEIRIKDLKYTLNTKNFLHKSAAWLLKSRIKSEMENNLNFLLQDNLDDLKKQAQGQLQNLQLNDFTTLKADLEEIGIQNAYLAPSGIRVSMALTGKLRLLMEGLQNE